MENTLSTTVGTRSVRCRNNSLNLRTLSQAPRHFEKQPITQSSVTIAYIHYSSQRASPPPRCTCAHVSQDSSPTTSAWSFLLHAGPSIYRAPGYPDLSAVLPPCVASLAEHEDSVEAFFSFLSDFFFFIVVILPHAQLCLALWHGWKCPHICTVIVIFSIDMRCFTNSAPAWRRYFSLRDLTARTRPAHSRLDEEGSLLV